MPNIIFFKSFSFFVFASDPVMTIGFDRKSAIYEDIYEDAIHSVLYVNVTCHVWTDDITTTVTLEYIGPRHYEVEVVQNETRHHRYRITVQQLMRLPNEGYIICSARGYAGSREMTEPISKLSTGDI